MWLDQTQLTLRNIDILSYISRLAFILIFIVHNTIDGENIDEIPIRTRIL